MCATTQAHSKPGLAPRLGARGFTLIEILVVMAIIGVIVALVASRLVTGGAQAKRQTTKITISQIVASIEHYSLDIGYPPERLDDLVHKPDSIANWGGPYIDDKELLDAWGHRFVYSNPGEHHDIDIVSYGADGRPGGEGARSQDVVSW
jgi:general secretion pathway protein G